MLNLWKKIQEKGHINTSPKRKETVEFTCLDPRYDGPLRGFELNANDIITSAQKCYLNATLDDIFRDNKIGYNYFKNFLESKPMTVEVLHLWSRISTNQSLKDGDVVTSDNQSATAAFAVRKMDSLLDGEAQANTSTSAIGGKLPDHLRNKLALLSNKGNVDDLSQADLDALKSIANELLREYWNEFLRSKWYCRYQVDLLTSRCITLADVLHHDTALSYFIQFLETEGCQHTVEFWFAATYHEKFVRNSINNGTYDTERNHALTEAIRIYEKYLSLQATCPLGFSDHVRCAVEEAICDEVNGPNLDCFKPAVNVVLAFLQTHYLIPFFSSQHYVHLLSDMIRNSTMLANHSPTSSISDFSVESKQPLLNKQDPDSIWCRRKQSGLSFGRIDQLGRFRRDIEPDPGRKNEWKISKMMKKWVQRGENKVEEEMAWQVAEMVVKDVIDLTMGCNGETDGVEED
ncbi:A-kinase anchor protein 10, mitochondrial [Planococcus citri]|uniref:A-kinase anchor protein 10, mitochondrial n=1 Tax=Planococcus citri TaxID=170843 RepID=UPI0031F8391D